MNAKLLKTLFRSQLGNTETLTFIELPPKKKNDVPMVKTINHWRLLELGYSHTYDKKDQEFSLPKLRRVK